MTLHNVCVTFNNKFDATKESAYRIDKIAEVTLGLPRHREYMSCKLVTYNQPVHE